MKIGYFQYLWLLIWNNLIKNSNIYSLLRKIYGFISYKWKTSKFVSWFRNTDGDVGKFSRAGKIFGVGFSALEGLQKRNEFFTKCKERSFVIKMCKYLLHNFLALNLRFIGILGCVACGFYTVAAFVMREEFALASAWGTVLFALMIFLNVNVIDFAAVSKIKAFAESLLGTTLSCQFYYMTKCNKSVTRYFVAVFFGILVGAAAIWGGFSFGFNLLAGVLCVAMIMYKTEFGVFLSAALLPFVSANVLTAITALTGFSLIVKGVTAKRFKWNFGVVGIFVILMSMIYFIAGLYSYTIAKSLKVWVVFAILMSGFLIVENTIRTRKQLLDLCKVIVLTALLMCIGGAVLRFLALKGGCGINMWLFAADKAFMPRQGIEILSKYLPVAIPLSLALLENAHKGGTKFFYGLATVFIGGTLFFAHSGEYRIVTVVMAALYITFSCGKLWGLAFFALPLLPFLLPENFWGAVKETGNVAEKLKTNGIDEWLGMAVMMKDVWIYGIGMGKEAFEAVYPYYAYSDVITPLSGNMFLQIWVQTGIGGIFTFALVLFFWFKQMCFGCQKAADKKLRAVILGLSIAVVGFLLQGIFDNGFDNSNVFMLFWFVLGLGMASVRIAKDE